MCSSGVNRSANSPLSDDEEKRHRVLGDSIVDDPDSTIIDSSFLRSTVLDDPLTPCPLPIVQLRSS